MCVLRQTSKLAKKLARAKEERFKCTVTDVRNIYNVCPGGEHCCEVSLSFVLKSITTHSLTSTFYSYTQGPELTVAASLSLSPKLGKDFVTLTPFLIFLSSRSHLLKNRINDSWNRFPKDERVFEAVDGTNCSAKQEMGVRK
jgi:hypothetical protein